MPATMPARSWSLPSVGEMLCTVCSSRSNCTGKRAVPQQSGEVVGLTLARSRRRSATSRPVMPSLIVGADCDDAVELDRDLLADVRLRDLLDELVGLERRRR